MLIFSSFFIMFFKSLITDFLSNDDTFLDSIESMIDIDNAIDYLLFINAIQANDNSGKNMFIFRYDEGYRLCYLPWDLDLTFGNKNSPYTVDDPDDLILTNNLFDRLFDLEKKKYESDNLRRYKRLERIADKAEKEKQFAAAINAEYRSGQLAGAYVDRKEVTVSGLEGMSREQLEKKLEELSNKIDGHNAKTIEVESKDVTTVEES
mgnify:CR=1 FL=1